MDDARWLILAGLICLIFAGSLTIMYRSMRKRHSNPTPEQYAKLRDIANGNFTTVSYPATVHYIGEQFTPGCWLVESATQWTICESDGRVMWIGDTYEFAELIRNAAAMERAT